MVVTVNFDFLITGSLSQPVVERPPSGIDRNLADIQRSEVTMDEHLFSKNEDDV